MCDTFTVTTTAKPTTAEPTTPEPTTPQPTSGLPTTTPDNLTGDCEANMDVIPYPGDCHKYYMCLDDGNNGYNLEVKLIL